LGRRLCFGALFDIGWVDEVTSQTIPINRRSKEKASVAAIITGTINYTVQEKFLDDGAWFSLPGLSTASDVFTATIGAKALRVIVNSYSSGAEIQANVVCH